VNVELANQEISLDEFPGIAFESDQNDEDCVWVMDKYGNGEPCYDVNDLLKTVESVYDGQQEGDFWRSPRGIAQATREEEMYD
jgi:hypothetical protein